MDDKEKIWKLNLNKTETIVINSDEHSEYFREISSHHVQVNLGFKSSHLESTSCMNLTDMVNYNWPQVKSTESLIAVHQSGQYIAYGISIANSKSSIRIHDVDSDFRHRVDELLYPVADLAFVSSAADENMMLAAIDQKGNVVIYVLYLLNGQFHYERYLEVTACEPTPPGPYKLVWHAGDKDSDIPRSLAVTRGKKIEIWNVDAIHAKHKQIASTTSLSLSSLAEDIMELTQHSGVVTRVCFSLDGAAVATASLDGTIMFFQIVDLDEPGVPKLLHSWEPHGGAPVTHMLLLDNLEEEACWRFLVSFSKDNSVMKVWSTETWTCLQVISFHGPAPSDSIRIIPYVDRHAKFIYLSDCHNKVFYVLEIFSDTTRPIAYVYKFAAFLVISPILSVHVNSCDVVPKPSHTGSGLMLGDDDEDDVDHDYSDLRDSYRVITHLNRIRLYILQPKSLQNCVLVFPALPVEPDLSRMVLVDSSSDADIDITSPTPLQNDGAQFLKPTPPPRLIQNNLQDACDPNLVSRKLQELLAAPAPPLPSSTDNQHLDLMTPDAFTSTTSLHNSPHSLHPTSEVLGSMPIVDVAILESQLKGNLATSSTNYEDVNTGDSPNNSNYRDVSSGSSPSREVEEIMQPFADTTGNSKEKETKISGEDKVDWPDAPPVRKVNAKTEKKSPLVETQTKKQRTYNGGPMFNETNHLSGPDPALETILIQLQKMAANIQALNSQVGTTVAIMQQSQQAIELQGRQLQALEQKVERLSGQQQEGRADEQKMNQELLVSQITQAVHNIVADKLQTLVVNHFNSVVMPKLVQSMNSLKSHINTELSQKLSATDSLLTENLAKIVESKAVLNTVTSAVLQNLQPGMTECFKDYFRRSITQYERATHTMLKQLSDTYDSGMRQVLQGCEQSKSQNQECLNQVQQVAESLSQAQRHFAGSLHSLESSLNESLAKHLTSQKAVLEGVVHSAVQSRTVTPVPNAVTSTVNQMHLKQNQINTFLMQKQFNAAFQQALSAQNLSLVLYVCENIPPSKLFDISPCPLEQHVIISLIQQLGGDLDTKTVLKCEYIDEALSALDPSHASTLEYAPNILRGTLSKLKSFSQVHNSHPAIKSVKKLERVILGVLRDFD